MTSTLKAVLNNTVVHIIIVTLSGILTQWLSSSAVGSLTVTTIVHSALEWLTAQETV